MPGLCHEVFLAVVRDRPALLGELLRVAAKGSLPPDVAVVDAAASFAPPADVRADLVLAQGSQGPWTLVEVQLEIDEEKRGAWPFAAAVLNRGHRAMGDIVVITAQRHVARWTSKVARASGPLGTRLVLVPTVLWLGEKQARALLASGQPELAFFAAWAMQSRHGSGAKRIVRDALEQVAQLPESLRGAQTRAI